MTTYQRERQPAHHIFHMKNFSEIVKTNVETHTGNLFEAEGYKWRMIVYPTGHRNPARGAHGYISVGVILETDASGNKLIGDWHVDAQVKVFVFNWKSGNYFVYQDDDAYDRFEEGVGNKFMVYKLLALDTFMNESNGYLRKDHCVFGAEIVVKAKATENDSKSLSMIKINPPSGSYFSWTIHNYSQFSKQKVQHSEQFLVGGMRCGIVIHPNGNDKAEGSWVSLYLNLYANISLLREVYADFKLRIVNQLGNANEEKNGTYWFSFGRRSSGFPQMLHLRRLYAEGFVANDSLKIEAIIYKMTKF